MRLKNTSYRAPCRKRAFHEALEINSQWHEEDERFSSIASYKGQKQLGGSRKQTWCHVEKSHVCIILLCLEQKTGPVIFPSVPIRSATLGDLPTQIERSKKSRVL